MTFRNRGFTLIEAMLGMMVMLTVASFIAPTFVRDLVLGRVMWERRLAVKFIESRLDQDCQTTGFATGNALATTITTVPELAAVSATWERSVTPVVVGELNQIIVTVRWKSQGQGFGPDPFESSAPYYISLVGVCG